MNNARPICPGVPSLASGWSLELQACGVRKLTSEEAAMLHTVKEDLNYICGGPIFPSGHELETKIGVRSDLSCANEVASQYYACKRGFPTVCYHCGSKDPHLFRWIQGVASSPCILLAPHACNVVYVCAHAVKRR